MPRSRAHRRSHVLRHAAETESGRLKEQVRCERTPSNGQREWRHQGSITWGLPGAGEDASFLAARLRFLPLAGGSEGASSSLRFLLARPRRPSPRVEADLSVSASACHSGVETLPDIVHAVADSIAASYASSPRLLHNCSTAWLADGAVHGEGILQTHLHRHVPGEASGSAASG